MAKKSPGQKTVNGLVALSSVAVLAVYSAGYAKTQSAADRIAAMHARRHTPPPAEGTPVTPSPAPAGASLPAPSAEPQQVATLNPHTVSPLPESTMGSDTIHVAPAPEHVSSVPQPASSVLSVAPAPEHVSSIPQPAPASQPASSSQPATPAKTEAKVDWFGFATADHFTPKDNTPADAKYKTGTFYGWGTCNHGDIQAAVVIADGRIDSTFIAQCLTRYSCDVISKLPDQAARRQGSNVDSVSGATESAEAFMQAIDDALTKAKNPNYTGTVSKSK